MSRWIQDKQTGLLVPRSATRQRGFIRVGPGFFNKSSGSGAIPACTWSPTRKSVQVTLSNGNLRGTKSANGGGGGCLGTSRFNATDSQGRYFEEVLSNSYGAAYYDYESAGVILDTWTSYEATTQSTSWVYYSQLGTFYDSTGGTHGTGATWTKNDVIGVYLKSGSIWFSKNGVWQLSGNPSTGANPTMTGIAGYVVPYFYIWRNADSMSGRFKASDFQYPIPTGGIAWGT